MIKNKIFKNMGVGLSLAMLGGCVWILRHELRSYPLGDILTALQSIPLKNLAQAFLMTIFDFLLLILCEILAFHFVQKKLPWFKIAWTSFTAYAFSNSVGFSGLSGASIRYRFYGSRGVSGMDIAKLIAFINSSFAFGFLLLAGLAFTGAPFTIPAGLGLPPISSRPLGILFLTAVAFYFVWLYSHKKPFKVKQLEFALPPLNLTILQIVLSAADFLLLGAIFYELLPANTDLSFISFIAIYLLALGVGIVSQVPGGLGVFETVILLTLPSIPKTTLVGCLLAFRALYYLIPLCIGAVLLGWHELRHQYKENLKSPASEQ